MHARDVPYFSLADNQTTVLCLDAAGGDTGVANVVTYTKRDIAGLDGLSAEDDDNREFATT